MVWLLGFHKNIVLAVIDCAFMLRYTHLDLGRLYFQLLIMFCSFVRLFSTLVSVSLSGS